MQPLNGASSASIVSLAASVEQRSEHPIAGGHPAVRRRSKASRSNRSTAVHALAGRGAEGQVNGSRILLGNHRLFEERELCSPALHACVEAMSAQGRTPVLVARNSEPIGLIAVADRSRANGRDTVDLLREQGIEAIVMLTGDSQATAQIDRRRTRSRRLPRRVDARRQGGSHRGTAPAATGSVAMVGDGINDAPALASADVGIAMGAAGSHVALETADVALMGDELLKIPYALRLSRATLRNIKVNLAISLVLKVAFVVAAVTGVATLWMAILADTGASVIVVANALRLLRAD